MSKVEPKRGFALGVGLWKIFWVFIVASVFGKYYEEILNYITTTLENGVGEWTIRQGLIHWPLSPVYGVGAVVAVVAFVKIWQTKPWQTFIFGALLGGAVEYFVSLWMEIFLHAESWNYTGRFLNIDGRTTVPFMIVWGLGAVLVVHKFYPWLSRMLAKVPAGFGVQLSMVLLALVVMDSAISFAAVVRMNERHEGVAAQTALGRYCDQKYPDEFLKNIYRNMKAIE